MHVLVMVAKRGCKKMRMWHRRVHATANQRCTYNGMLRQQVHCRRSSAAEEVHRSSICFTAWGPCPDPPPSAQRNPGQPAACLDRPAERTAREVAWWQNWSSVKEALAGRVLQHPRCAREARPLPQAEHHDSPRRWRACSRERRRSSRRSSGRLQGLVRQAAGWRSEG
jgi:hypothetical protein